MLFILSLCALSFSFKDNAEFKGKVIDDQTGEAIIMANIVHIPTNTKTQSDFDGNFTFPFLPEIGDQIVVTYVGYEKAQLTVTNQLSCVIRLKSHTNLDESIEIKFKNEAEQLGQERMTSSPPRPATAYLNTHYYEPRRHSLSSESYESINENEFLSAADKPLSTFSIDVDGASYSNVRRFINQGQKPPVDAVRIEEFINYFNYDYNVRSKGKPFGVVSELGSCPWNEKHQLLHIGIKGREVDTENIPASNLVFLIDVSGSMNQSNKLPLLIQSFKMLVNQMREQDKIALVTYAGRAGVVLEPTSGANKVAIHDALDRLRAGGSTAGAQGIKTAYDLAKQHFIKNGNNRVILATDGDFNVGISSDKDLVNLIEEKRKDNIFLNVLGFGMGNYKESKMQKLANSGNGSHSYIDNIHEARKVFVDELQGTLFTIAKDIKIQIEFNPTYVSHYRLIGYENRLLRDRDFNDDTKDAGEIGAGHSVTALYEIVPVGTTSNINNVDPLKYQKNNTIIKGSKNGEMATLKMRHKSPEGNISERQVWIIESSQFTKNLSNNYYWSAAMACFGMALRNSDHLANGSYSMAETLALKGKGEDKWGYRTEALNIIRSADALFGTTAVGQE